MERQNVDLVLEQIVPGPATESIADDELEDVKGEVGDDAEDPNNYCPTPPDALNPCEAP